MASLQRLVGCLLLLLLIEEVTHFIKAEDNIAATQGGLNQDQLGKWSKPATAQRRQGDWVPLTVPCPGCQPIGDQGQKIRDSISSVLTPPVRLQEARLLPPPLPSESLYQQAASTGFLQTFQQPPPFNNKGRQQQIPLQGGQFVQQPIHQNQQFRHHEENNQNQQNSKFLNQQPNLQVFQINPQAYTQQHAQLLNPSLLNVPQQAIPPHYISGFIPPPQQSAPTQFQQINIAENQHAVPVPVAKPNFQNQPVFNQHSSIANQNTNSKPQLLDHQRRPIENGQEHQIRPIDNHQEHQRRPTGNEHSLEEQKNEQQVYNNASDVNHNSNEGNEEVQLLYVPVETLRQRGRNLSRPKQNSQFQTISLPANFGQQITNIHNNDHLNFPSSPGNSEVFHQNQQNSQLQQQQNVQYNQGAVTPSLENSHEFSQNKPNIQYKQLPQTTSIEDTQVFTQNNPNIQYRQQGFIPSTENSQEFPQSKPNIQQEQSAFTSSFENSQEFNQNKQNVQFQQPAFTSSPEVVYRQQQVLQKPIEKEHQIQQTHIQQDLPQDTTSVYTTPSTKKHRFHKTKENIETANQLAHQQYLQETTHELSAKNQPATLHSELNGQHLNSAQNTQRSNLESNDQHFRSEPNDQQFEQANEQPLQTRSRQQIPSRQVEQSEQGFQPQQSLRTIDSQRYITQQSSTIPPPHQPPLSVYMESGENSKVSDVLNLLKNAKTIPVLDTVGAESPQVFVGPSNLEPPNGYIKFELPYLSSLENNRVERKVDRLPFFVAPLNFNPPPGYSKIPFPAPHIGSVVVSNVTILREALHEKPYIVSPSPISSTTRSYSDSYTLPANISPISPQLPSLVNSLQDEIYSPQVITEPTTSTTTTTTEAYTTPYQRRTQSRGSHRGHSTYLTSTTTPSPRRSPTRQRRPYNGRPYSHRQPVTTPTTTPLPTTEESDTRTQYTSQSEAQSYDAQPLFSQSNEQATGFNKAQQQLLQNTQNLNKFSNQQFDTNVNYDSAQENNAPLSQTPSYEFLNQNVQHGAINLKTQQADNAPRTQYNKNVAFNNYDISSSSSTESSVTTENTKVVPSFQGIRDENAFQSQRANNPRRENTLRNQRHRGRGSYRSQQTTTTEANSDYITTDSQFNPNTYQEVRNNYKLNVNPFNYKNHKYVEQVDDTDIKAQTRQPDYKYPIQTERSDVSETTETQQKYSTAGQNQYDESFIQPKPNNRAQQNDYSNVKTDYVQQNQFQQQPANQHQNINIQQQTQIQPDVDHSKQTQQSQLQSIQVLNNNEDYSGQTQGLQFQTSQLVNQQQQSAQPIHSQSVQSLNRNNQHYLVQTQTPHLQSHSPQRQEVQNYNSQTQQVINSKNNQQEYYVQPVQTKSTQNQNIEDQQYISQVQSKQGQLLEPQTSTQQNYLAQVQQRQQHIPKQVSQEQYQQSNQNDQRYQQIQNPKFVQEYDVNFQSQTPSTAQNDYSATNRNVQPTEVTPQHESSILLHNSQQIVSQTPAADEQLSVTGTPHNQQRLTKYNTRSRSRNPINSQQLEEIDSQRAQFNSNLQEESQYQNSDVPLHSTLGSILETTTQEPTTTTKSPLVRVRGRVRSRQRGQPRTHYTTTTEVPNYPANVLRNDYRTDQIDEQISNSQYNPQKRVNKNYKSRQTYDSLQEFGSINTEQTTSTNNIYTSESQPISTSYPTTEAITTEAPVTKLSRRYKHVLNRNIQRRPTKPTQSTLSPSSTSTPASASSGTPKYLVRTTRRPPTRLTGGRARIRKPTTTSTTTTTTEYPQIANPSWLNSNVGTNFAPSAASNEVIDPYYSNQNAGRPLYNNYDEQVKPSVRAPAASAKSPTVETVNDDDDYWNQAVTIQQSTSFDYKPDASPVTQSTFQGTFEPAWDDQLSFKNDNYYDNYNPQSGQQSNSGSSLDQTPFPSNEQRVIYMEIKDSPHIGKANQWNEKVLLDQKNQGDSKGDEIVENYSLAEQEKITQIKKHLPDVRGQTHYNKKQTVINEDEEFATSENENSNTGTGLNRKDSSKGETFSDRISTSTEVDKTIFKNNVEEKPEVPVAGKKVNILVLTDFS